jgi:DNA-binding CsgD family transcriptional regulator
LTTSAGPVTVNTHIAHVGAAVFVDLQTLERSVQLVEQLGELTDPAAFASIVLPALAELVGCDVITYNEVGLTPASVHYEDWPRRALDAQTRQTFAHFAHQHPSIEHYRRTRDRRPVLISDFLTTGQFHRLDLYAEFFRLIPVEHQISLSLNEPGSVIVGIALNRTRKEFDEVDRAVLAILRRPLLAALTRVRLGDRGTSSSVDDLSARERDVLELVATGQTNAAIARALGVSPRTVAKHLEHIYQKLQVANRAAAVARREPQASASTASGGKSAG